MSLPLSSAIRSARAVAAWVSYSLDRHLGILTSPDRRPTIRSHKCSIGATFGAVPSRRLSPDTALTIALQASGRRLIEDGVAFEDVAAHLRAEAAGRTDLLADAAGSVLGGYLAAGTTAVPNDMVTIAALVVAGAEPARAIAHADAVRARVGSGPHGT